MTNPLSLVRVEDGWIFTAGQVGIEPGEAGAPEDFEAQARIALANLERVIVEAGGSLASVQKTTVFLVRREDFAAMNALYAAAFPEPFPARSTVICDLVLPELLFEIEAVARVERS
jgi:2-iminobutanoate/2-iminopropanoate deaminase